MYDGCSNVYQFCTDTKLYLGVMKFPGSRVSAVVGVGGYLICTLAMAILLHSTISLAGILLYIPKPSTWVHTFSEAYYA